MSDDEIALKLMRLYKQLRQAYDPEVRRAVCETIDALVGQLKHLPGFVPGQAPPARAPQQQSAAGDD